MDAQVYIRFVVALVFVLALIGLFYWAARRFGLGGAAVPVAGRNRRLRVVEVAQIDGRRRLVLVRRDDVEHLVILGQSSEAVIETGIPAPPDDPAGPEHSGGGANFRSIVESVARRRPGGPRK